MTDAHDSILAALSKAQRAPADNYMIWARLSEKGRPIEIPLETMRMPLTMSTEVVRERVEQRAAKTLGDIGFSTEAIAAARYYADPLPTAEELEALFDAEIRSGAKLTLVDLIHWEACKARLHLIPSPVLNGRELQLDYKGLKIQQSAAS